MYSLVMQERQRLAPSLTEPNSRGTPDLPITGTAAYDGFAGGLYAAQAGDDAQIEAFTIEMGEFEGDIALTANFDTQDISGTVDNIYLDYTQFTPDGGSESGASLTDYEMELGAAPFGPDGTFAGSDVTITHPSFTTHTDGSWGGRFSTTDDSAGNPRVVAGTFGGRRKHVRRNRNHVRGSLLWGNGRVDRIILHRADTTEAAPFPWTVEGGRMCRVITDSVQSSPVQCSGDAEG